MIDLHMHSTASDGTLSPAELMTEASAAGISTLALTDHDTIDGVAAARQAATELGLQLLSGIELSVTWSNRTLHLVGLNFDEHNPSLGRALQQALEYRVWRAQEIARKLEQCGVPNALAGAYSMANTDLISRSHFARFLVEQGFAKDIRQVFKRYMVKGKPGFVGSQWMSLEQGVNLIHGAGGIAVLAHPARYRLNRSKLRGLLGELQEMGVAGIEVVSGSHSREENLLMAQHAIDFDLGASQGSDYHGPEKPWVKLGALPPMNYRCCPIWERVPELGISR